MTENKNHIVVRYADLSVGCQLEIDTIHLARADEEVSGKILAGTLTEEERDVEVEKLVQNWQAQIVCEVEI